MKSTAVTVRSLRRTESDLEAAVKVYVDEELCVGHGRCYVLAPEVFAADDYGHCEIRKPEVEGADVDSARTAASNCPEQAITLRDE